MNDNLGFVGLGNFGRFFIPHLKQHFGAIYTFDTKKGFEADAESLGVCADTLEEVLKKEVIILAIPVQYLEAFLASNALKFNPNAIVMDVSSVKVKPMALMEKYLPKSCEIIGTHPLFGPQSGKNGIEGLNFVISPLAQRCSDQTKQFIVDLFGKSLKLKVLERTDVEHDSQMAYVQALTHFIGRALNRMDIPEVEQKTPAYQYLLDIKRNLGGDSWDLFLTIENENMHSKGIRDEFLKELMKLNEELN